MNPEPRPLTAHGAARRKWLWMALLLLPGLVALELGWYVLGRAMAPWRAVAVRQNPGARLTPPRFDGTLRIVTYNICHGRGGDQNLWAIRHRADMMKRVDDIAAMLAEEQPDIAVLNEIDFDSLPTGRLNEARYIAEKAGYPFRVEQRNVDASTLFFFSERSGNAVLSRHPIRHAELVSFPGHKKWETIMGGKSQAVLCDIAIQGGPEIRLLATHLASFSEQVRVASARIIEARRQASALPFFVVGDLNSSPAGFPNHRVYNGENAMDILLGGGGFTTQPLADPTPADCTIGIGRPVATVDWILLPAAWRVLSRRVLPLTASDHYPVAMSAGTLP